MNATEDIRLENAKVRILRRLQQGPATNADLSRIALRFGARVLELRGEGYRIDKALIGRGVYRYELRPQDRLF